MLKHVSVILLLFVALSVPNEPIDITREVIDFSASCVEIIVPKEEPLPGEKGEMQPDIPEFELLNFLSEKDSSLLSFRAIANCAQINKGKIFITHDTLSIQDTDVSIKTEIMVEIDSLGNESEIIVEREMGEITFCDCLITYSYRFSRDLSEIKFLLFDKKSFILKPD